MKLPHPIPYQGSKRNLADVILHFFSVKFDRLIEPFVGSAAISIAAAFYYNAKRFVLNDINQPLMNLWKSRVNDPQYIISCYHDIWHRQQNDLVNNIDEYVRIKNK